MKKTILVTAMMMIIIFASHAQAVSETEAYKLAENWISLKGNQEVYLIKSKSSIQNGNTLLAYCFELHPTGYIVVSNDQRIRPIIAYSFNSNYRQEGQQRKPLEDILVYDLSRRMEHIPEMNQQEANFNIGYHARLLAGHDSDKTFEQWPPAGSTSTGGWLETNWKQSAPYNDLCPLDNVTGNRSVAGCPAVALAMIIHYQKNLNGIRFDDGDDYYHNYAGRQYWIDDDSQLMDFASFPRLNAHFDSIEYKYPLYIPLNNEEKAALVFACGVAAEQVYTSEVSGTFGVDQAFDAYMRFNFEHAVLMYDNDTSFYSHMKDNIMNSIPVHLALLVDGGGGGHNVVADGYNTDDFYHLNFGWGGSYNGWYNIPEEIPYNLTIVEGAVMDIGESHVGISKIEMKQQKVISTYPNPSHGSFNISLDIHDPGNAELVVVNMAGTIQDVVVSGFLGKGKHTYRVHSDLPPGMYNIKMLLNGYSYTAKLIIEN